MQSQPSSDRCRILIVDDEEDVVRPIAFRLEMHGYEVLMEPDGELGFQTAVVDQPDLILLDMMMPRVDGVSLCNILKDRDDTCDIPVIFLTAKSTMGAAEAAFAAKAHDFVAKPFEWDELLGKIRRALAENSVAQSSRESLRKH